MRTPDNNPSASAHSESSAVPSRFLPASRFLAPAHFFPQPPVSPENGKKFAVLPSEDAGKCRADSLRAARISFQRGRTRGTQFAPRGVGVSPARAQPRNLRIALLPRRNSLADKRLARMLRGKLRAKKVEMLRAPPVRCATRYAGALRPRRADAPYSLSR
jgi:hypothetical protein